MHLTLQQRRVCNAIGQILCLRANPDVAASVIQPIMVLVIYDQAGWRIQYEPMHVCPAACNARHGIAIGINMPVMRSHQGCVIIIDKNIGMT
jgi:hypothetical protein